MRFGLQTIVLLGGCCGLLIWSTAPTATIQAAVPTKSFERTADTAKEQRLVERVNALQQEVGQAARQLEAVGTVYAGAAGTLERLAKSAASTPHATATPHAAATPALPSVTPAVMVPILTTSVAAASALPAPVVPPLPFTPKTCPAGCEEHGVCNPELGRCDCQPFMGGDDCSKPLIGACASAVQHVLGSNQRPPRPATPCLRHPERLP